ncbi:MAG: transcriptional repressor [Sedimentisphaerales bacterium]|nr:transcriptional repressor [Sedimentisphaerales bacterium]
MEKVISILRSHQIQPTPQRIATAKAVFDTRTHPSADEVWEKVKRDYPTVSRATVYNTLNLLVNKGVLKTQILREGKVVFDPCIEPHHHFIDDETGEIHDVPWDALQVKGEDSLKDYKVREYQVVMRGCKKKQ